MPGGSFGPGFWTRVLGENNLESPGYHEAVRDANEISRKKKEEKQKTKTKTK